MLLRILPTVLFMVICATAAHSSAAQGPAPCRDAVQGKIAWDSHGNTKWDPANIERLCRGATSDQPARCFERVMRGGVDWGGGTEWSWSNAIDLCQRTRDAAGTINCFQQKLREGRGWQAAIPACAEPDVTTSPARADQIADVKNLIAETWKAMEKAMAERRWVDAAKLHVMLRQVKPDLAGMAEAGTKIAPELARVCAQAAAVAQKRGVTGSPEDGSGSSSSGKCCFTDCEGAHYDRFTGHMIGCDTTCIPRIPGMSCVGSGGGGGGSGGSGSDVCHALCYSEFGPCFDNVSDWFNPACGYCKSHNPACW